MLRVAAQDIRSQVQSRLRSRGTFAHKPRCFSSIFDEALEEDDEDEEEEDRSDEPPVVREPDEY
jgi:hypothetical protein